MEVFSNFIVSAEKMLSKLQKFVFSATLTYSSTSKKNKKDNFGNVHSYSIIAVKFCTAYYDETTAR